MEENGALQQPQPSGPLRQRPKENEPLKRVRRKAVVERKDVVFRGLGCPSWIKIKVE